MSTVYARISDKLKDRLQEEARKNGISMSEQVRLILEKYFGEEHDEKDVERIGKVIEEIVSRKLRLYTVLALAISENISICSECYALNDKYDWYCKRCGGKTVKGSKLLDQL
jgi:ribosomal protein L40E